MAYIHTDNLIDNDIIKIKKSGYSIVTDMRNTKR